MQLQERKLHVSSPPDEKTDTKYTCQVTMTAELINVTGLKDAVKDSMCKPENLTRTVCWKP